MYNGGGVGVGDINNDGLADIYFAGNQVPDQLYLNLGDLRFKEITQEAGIQDYGGWSSGITMVDINQDGWLDIYVCKTLYDSKPDLRANELYVNQRDGTFSEEAAAWGIADQWRSQQALFVDYDLDGDEDLFLVNQPPNPALLSPLHGQDWLDPKLGCRLYRNDLRSFTDVTEEAGVSNRGYGLSAVSTDFNRDGWPDIYVANDYDSPDFLYINNGDGTLDNVINEAMNHISYFSMGSDIGDINNDGLQDLVVLDMVAEDNYRLKANMGGMEPEKFWSIVDAGGHHQYMFNSLQLNRGNKNNIPYFSDIAQFAGISNSDWSWSPLLGDFDNDGFLDLFITNGIKRDLRFTDAVKNAESYLQKKIDTYQKNNPSATDVAIWEIIDREEIFDFFPSTPLRNYIFKNSGDYLFSDKSASWGIGDATFSTGAAYADLDNDGDLDLVINNVDQVGSIYENQSGSTQHHLRVKFTKNGVVDHRSGMIVKLFSGLKKQVAYGHRSRGFYSSSEGIIHFGLGDIDFVDSMQVVWPDGSTLWMYDFRCDSVLSIEKSRVIKSKPTQKRNSPIFRFASVPGLDFKHTENHFDDFEREVLLPHRLSMLGPYLSVADVNSDGRQDVFAGGALLQAGKLILQDSNSFGLTDQQPWENDIYYEDMGSAFFDADNDGDVDLYVVSGGNEYEASSTMYQDRLYLNDGTGQFRKAEEALPQIRESGSIVLPGDYDGDGDIDLFVAGRQVPGLYPTPASSHILQNQLVESGSLRFDDVTPQRAPGLLDIGMITDACWSDVDQDGKSDLVLSGMWMAPTFFLNRDNSLHRISTELDSLKGWWFSIVKYDFDGDGDDDFILGNIGKNYKYKAGKDEPFSVYFDDFDQNGKKDIVLSYYNFGNVFPVRGRSCSSQQIPGLAEKFPTYDLFASSSLHDIYGTSSLESALHLDATSFESIIVENQGKLQFDIHPLPSSAQFSNINDWWVGDFDDNQIPDIIGVGNLYGSEVETPRNDAHYGVFLRGTSPFNFQEIAPSESGILIKGDAKSIVRLNGPDGNPLFMVGLNNDSLVTFSMEQIKNPAK